MASAKDTGDLFIKVGLDLSAVDKGLVYLNRKVDENVTTLQEKLKQNKIKLDIDTSKIGSSVTDTIKAVKNALGNTAGDLILKAGLDLSAVDKDLVYFNRKIDENVTLLQEKLKQRTIKLDTDAKKIDTKTTAGSDERFRVDYHGLKEIEKLQQQIVNLREIEFQVASKTAGINSNEAQKALRAKKDAEKEIAETQQKLNKEVLDINPRAERRKMLEDYHKAQSAQSTITSPEIRRSNENWINGNRNPYIQESAATKETTEYLKNQYHILKNNEQIQQQILKLREAEFRNIAKISGADSEKAQKALTAKSAVEKEITATQKAIQETTEYLKILGKIEEAEKHHQAKSLQDAIKNNRTAYRANSRWGREETFKDNASAKIEKISNTFNELRDASGSVGDIVSKTLEIFGRVPSTLGKAGVAAGAFAAALIALPIAAKKVQDSLIDLASPALKSGDALYAASRGAQMTIKDFAEFSRVCKVTGIEISEVTNMSKKMQAALIRVESDPSGTNATAANAKYLVNTLKQYGVEIRKANGELKNHSELQLSVAEGLKKAQEAGRGRDFLVAIGASGDYATYLEDLAGNIELEKSIVKNALADATLAHNTQGYLNALNLQKETLQNTLSSAFVPVAYDIIPQITEQLGRLTDVINKNADGIRAIAEVAGNAAVKVTELGVGLAEVFAKGADFVTDKLEIGKEERDFIQNLKKTYGNQLKNIGSFDDYLNIVHPDIAKDIQDYNSGEALKRRNQALENERKKLAAEIEKLKKEAEDKLKAEKEAFANRTQKADKTNITAKFEENSQAYRRRENIKAQLEADITEITRLSHLAEREINGKFNLLEDRATRLNKILKEYGRVQKWQSSDDYKTFFNDDTGNDKSSLTPEEENARLARMAKLREELHKLKLESQFGGDWYGKSLAELKNWTDQQLKIIEPLKKLHFTEYNEEYALIKETANEKLLAIERKRHEETRNLMQETANIEYQMTHSALEKELHDIEIWKNAQLSKGNVANQVATIEQNAAARAVAAIKRETDAFKKNLQSLEEKIFAQEHSQRDRDILEAQKERAEMLKQGYPEDRVNYWYENRLAEIAERARKDRDYRKKPKLARAQSDPNKIDIGYGDSNNSGNGWINLTEGWNDLTQPKNQNQVPDFLGEINSKVEQAFQQNEKLSNAAEQAAQYLAQIETDSVNEKLGTFGDAITNATETIKKSLDNLQQNNSQPNSPQQNSPQQNSTAQATQNNNNDMVNKSLDASQTITKVGNVVGTAMSAAELLAPGWGRAAATAINGVRLALASGTAEILLDTAQQAHNFNAPTNPPQTNNTAAAVQQNLPNFEAFNFGLDKAVTSLEAFNLGLDKSVGKLESVNSENTSLNIDISPITSELVTLTQTIGGIAQDLKAIQQQKAEPPVINVNPTINNNLAGAYVFDNAMKNQLTDDITTNVANGITEAIQKAQAQGNFGYSN